jgi:hypothetical protein
MWFYIAAAVGVVICFLFVSIRAMIREMEELDNSELD